MDISVKKIPERIRSLIIQPKEFWKVQNQTTENQSGILFRFYFPLLLIVSSANFLGELISSVHFYPGFAAAKAGREFILYTLQYFISVFFTAELMKSFGGKRNVQVAQKLVVYSLTPFLLVSVVTGLFPFLYALDAVGMYGFYIFWIGVQEMLDLPERKQSSYILVAILVNFFLFSFLSIFLSKLLTAYI
ncbi:MAG: Yip1 family protein [Prolixibacteraceae bacterium]